MAGGAGAECLGGVTVGLGAELGRVVIGWVRCRGNSIVMIMAIVVDPWNPQGSMGGFLLWEDLPPIAPAYATISLFAAAPAYCIHSSVCRIAYATVPLFAAESAALAALECPYVRPNGLHLGVGETFQPFGCMSSLLKC